MSEQDETPKLVAVDEVTFDADIDVDPAAPQCVVQVTDREGFTRRCLNRTRNPNRHCPRHQLEARIEAARRAGDDEPATPVDWPDGEFTAGLDPQRRGVILASHTRRAPAEAWLLTPEAARTLIRQLAAALDGQPAVPLGTVRVGAMVTSHAPAPEGSPVYWVVGHEAATTRVRSIASGAYYDWPGDRMVETRG